MRVLRRLVRRARFEVRSYRRARLLHTVPKHAVCAEIGVWKGHFSAEILRVVEPRKLHLIDPWAYQEEYGRALFGGGLAGSQAFMDDVYDHVIARFRNEIESGTVEVHREFSAEAAAQFPDGYFDFVYVDGNHVYEYVRQDLISYLPKLKIGGLLAGDDYHDHGWFEGGVKRAVDEFVSTAAVELVRIGGKQFLLKRTSRRAQAHTAKPGLLSAPRSPG
jgi:hypothetical protein